jgi:hypothetical protein
MKTASQLWQEAEALRSQAAQIDVEARRLDRAERAAKLRENEAIPVNRDDRRLTNGQPVPDDNSHTEITAGGQQKAYVVLSEAERSKGFVRPFRDAYRHLKCGRITAMGRSLAETYARDPFFYGGTFCAMCQGHFPVGEDGEFTWYEMDGTEGQKVGT